MILHLAATATNVHAHRNLAACGTWSVRTKSALTSTTAEVTCGRCVRTAAYLQCQVQESHLQSPVQTVANETFADMADRAGGTVMDAARIHDALSDIGADRAALREAYRTYIGARAVRLYSEALSGTGSEAGRHEYEHAVRIHSALR